MWVQRILREQQRQGRCRSIAQQDISYHCIKRIVKWSVQSRIDRSGLAHPRDSAGKERIYCWWQGEGAVEDFTYVREVRIERRQLRMKVVPELARYIRQCV